MKVIIVDNDSKNIETHVIAEPGKEYGKWTLCNETGILYADKNHISRKSGDEDAVRYIYHLKCSKCHKVTSVLGAIKYDFCPHCGTMMIIDDRTTNLLKSKERK